MLGRHGWDPAPHYKEARSPYCLWGDMSPCTHIHVCTHARANACTYNFMHICAHTHTHTCMHTTVCAQEHTRIHAYTCIHRHRCMHIHTHAHTYMHICMHIHMHTHMLTHTLPAGPPTPTHAPPHPQQGPPTHICSLHAASTRTTRTLFANSSRKHKQSSTNTQMHTAQGSAHAATCMQTPPSAQACVHVCTHLEAYGTPMDGHWGVCMGTQGQAQMCTHTHAGTCMYECTCAHRTADMQKHEHMCTCMYTYVCAPHTENHEAVPTQGHPHSHCMGLRASSCPTAAPTAPTPQNHHCPTHDSP